MKLIRIHPRDNVAVALTQLCAGEQLSVDGIEVTAREEVARGHKIALRPIAQGGMAVWLWGDRVHSPRVYWG